MDLPFLWLLLALAALGTVWFRWRRQVEVPCSIDLESTHDHFHAHVELEGLEPEPGDAVTVGNTPSRIAFGEKRTYRSRATVAQASALRRWWTKWRSRLDITELYEVGFE